MSRRRARQWAGRSVAELRQRWGRETVEVFGKVDSTNAVARVLAEGGSPAGTIVLAREQTEGRGRAGRRWHSPPGGVYLSMVFRPETATPRSFLSILAALGVVGELDARFAGLEPRLKWPNDILARNRKLAGVLPEAASDSAGVRYLVVGVGVNVRPLEGEAARLVEGTAISLEEALGREVDPLIAADAVVAGLERVLRSPPRALDAATLERLDRYDGLKGRRIRLRSPEGPDPVSGVAVGIAPDGALLFRPDRGALRRVTTGTVEMEEA